MRVECINLYKFEELSTTAKENATDNFEPYTDFIYEDVELTAKAFCEAFNVKTSYNSWLRYSDCYESDLEITGIRLRTYILNNYGNLLFKGKYYGKLVDTFKDGSKIEKSKEHPVGLRHVKRYSKVFFTNDCNLTGVCYDYYVLKPLYDFIKNPQENIYLWQLLDEGLQCLEYALEEEIQYRNSREGKEEELLQLEREYTENGEPHN